MKFNRNTDFKRLFSLEWLETNGIGGYASSTVINCHTRRYHGLLVAKLEKPAGKFVLLSNLEDSILIGNNEFFLSSFQYPGVIHPKGYKNLYEFNTNEVPAFQYHIGKMLIKKEIMLVQKKNTVLIKYSGFNKGVKAKLRIKPLLAYRDFHSLSRENSQVQTQTFKCKKGFFISPYYGMPDMFFQTNRVFQFRHSHDWYRNFEYIEERSRGFECHEDLFIPGIIEINIKEGEEIVLSASIEEQKESLKRKWNREIFRREKKTKKLKGSYFQKNLLKAADQFIVEDREGNKSVIAGYPWFLEWGRDAMIALPGLTLYSEKERDCLEILKTFARYERKGIVPNFIGDTLERTAYNSADASLWFAWAIQKYLEKTKDHKAVKQIIWPTMKQIFLHYKKGTLFNIKMMDNGLLRAGGKDMQITWMDATAYGKPVTPRDGCPVEINALWYNLVCFVDELGRLFHDKITKETEVLIEKIALSFNKHFWVSEGKYLGDVYKENGCLDKAIRPNQIFAVSLPYSPLPLERAQAVMATVEKELLTERGLRTLSPGDQNYNSRYEGGHDERDSAYHNGTVWPWLIGHYGEALLKSASDKKKAVVRLKAFLAKFEDHLVEGGLFTVSEIFDGNPPHFPRGCISQAWSVAEILRLSYLISNQSKKDCG